MLTVGAILPNLGVPELLLILLIFVLIFGAAKLPQLGRGLGEGIKNFRKSVKGEDEGHRAELRESTETRKE